MKQDFNECQEVKVHTYRSTWSALEEQNRGKFKLSSPCAPRICTTTK